MEELSELGGSIGGKMGRKRGKFRVEWEEIEGKEKKGKMRVKHRKGVGSEDDK